MRSCCRDCAADNSTMCRPDNRRSNIDGLLAALTADGSGPLLVEAEPRRLYLYFGSSDRSSMT